MSQFGTKENNSDDKLNTCMCIMIVHVIESQNIGFIHNLSFSWQ